MWKYAGSYRTREHRVVWQTPARFGSESLAGIHRQSLPASSMDSLPRWARTLAQTLSSNTSYNAKAYELYLQAVSEGDPTNSRSSFSSGNKHAIQLFSAVWRSIPATPQHGRHWSPLLLQQRLREGDESSILNAKAALQPGCGLDPGRIDAASDLINIESEEGDLNQAT